MVVRSLQPLQAVPKYLDPAPLNQAQPGQQVRWKVKS
jgi:hypothetical protein